MSVTQAITSAAGTAHDRGAGVLGGRHLDERKTAMRRHGVAGQFSVMIRGAVLLAVGVFVVGAIFNAINLQSGDPLFNASQQVESLTGQAFEIAPVVLIVIVAVLILTFVRDL
jgi:hypothetical protein